MTSHPLRWTVVFGAAASAMLAGCGGPASPLTPARVLRYDAVARTVNITARAGYGGLSGELNFDGYADGQLTLHVPYGWLVSVTCVNDSHLLQHSCAVVPDTPPTLGARPLAFPEASSPDPTNGSAPATSTTFEFVANRAGSYRIACLVHGHEIDGMWDHLLVQRGVVPSATIGR